MRHGRVRTWRTILVQSRNDGKGPKDARYKERINMTPYTRMYGKKKDISKFSPFGCKAFKKRQAHSKSSWGNQSRFCYESQHQWMQTVYSVDKEDCKIQPGVIQ
jgi:hypothetical protein